MWRRLFKPEVLFLFGTLQALSPYLLWYAYGPNVSYNYRISYIPAVIWIVGYLCFWLGAKCAGEQPAPASNRPLVGHTASFVWLTVLVLAAILLQCIALAHLFGGIPMLQFFSGQTRVWDVDQAVLERGFLGQMGLFLCSELVLDALILILLMTLTAGQRRHRVLLAAAILVTIGAGIFAGKRQALAIGAVMLMSGSVMYFGHPARPFLRYLGLRRPKWTARFLLVAVPMGLFASLGIIATLRMGSAASSVSQIVTYSQLGLINLEVQAAEAGLGPKHYNGLRLTQYIVPDRVVRRLGLFAKDPPPRAEPTAPAGFYGDLHWNVGLPGVIVFSFAVGMLSKYFYRRAPASLFHLLVYSLMTWTLIAPFLYNHFLFANFLLFPSIFYWIITRLGGKSDVKLIRPCRARRRKAVDLVRQVGRLNDRVSNPN